VHYDKLPRVCLTHLPTPLERLPRLSERLGIDLWIKRDDCTGLAFGGNKSRKLEFTLGEALAQGADTVIAASGFQSNFLRQTAAAAAKLGLEFHGIIAAPSPGRHAPYFRSGNLLLDHLFGATLHIAQDEESATEALARDLMDELRRRGRRPFRIPLGASDAVGSVGYVECAREVLAQCAADRPPATIVIVTGSAGGQAGLLVGLRALGATTKVIGVSCSESSAVKRSKVKAILQPLAARIQVQVSIHDDEIIVEDAYTGGGYAVPTDAANDAIRMTAALEGVALDPIYTGKGMAAVADLARRGLLPREGRTVFVHTGGTPALFVYDDLFWTGIKVPRGMT
jgi:L-cysteate sulfo-lyase